MDDRPSEPVLSQPLFAAVLKRLEKRHGCGSWGRETPSPSIRGLTVHPVMGCQPVANEVPHGFVDAARHSDPRFCATPYIRPALEVRSCAVVNPWEVLSCAMSLPPVHLPGAGFLVSSSRGCDFGRSRPETSPLAGRVNPQG